LLSAALGSEEEEALLLLSVEDVERLEVWLGPGGMVFALGTEGMGGVPEREGSCCWVGSSWECLKSGKVPARFGGEFGVVDDVVVVIVDSSSVFVREIVLSG
jgi:hypothetical protein